MTLSYINRPLLKAPAVFEGIAGILTGEQGEADDLLHMPSILSKTREFSKLQDVYRKTLAASWAAQVGELPADRCIEEIFAGRDGWGGQGPDDNIPKTGHASDNPEDNESENDQRLLHSSRRKSPRLQPPERKPATHRRINSRDIFHDHSHEDSSHHHVRSATNKDAGSENLHMRAQEVDEFVTREDLRSWQISSTS